MVVKSHWQYHLIYGIVLVLLISIFGNLIATSTNTVMRIVVASFALIIIIGTTRIWIATGRTFIFDKDGITVRFLFFKRFYRWNEMKLKKTEDLSKRMPTGGGLAYYTSGAVFSAKESEWSPCLRPIDHAAFSHPFSFIFVHFSFKPRFSDKWMQKSHDEIYFVNEAEFMKKMREWNVFP